MDHTSRSGTKEIDPSEAITENVKRRPSKEHKEHVIEKQGSDDVKLNNSKIEFCVFN